MKNVLLTCCILLAIPCTCVHAAAADEAVNLAPAAEVWASSEYSDSWAAKYAIDGKVPHEGSGTDAGASLGLQGRGIG